MTRVSLAALGPPRRSSQTRNSRQSRRHDDDRLFAVRLGRVVLRRDEPDVDCVGAD